MPNYQLPKGDNIQAKPLIFGKSALDDDRLDGFEKALGRYGVTYVPGYSEMKAENELRIKDGNAPIPIPRLQWVRIKRPNAGDYVVETDEGMVEFVRLGYRAMGVEDLDRYGYGWPPAAGSKPNSDGLICIGDLALFYVDADTAKRNRRIRQAELKEEAQGALEKQYEPGAEDIAERKISPLTDDRSDEDGKLFLGDLKRD